MTCTLHRTLALSAIITGLCGAGCGGKPPPCAPTGPSCIAWPPQSWPEKLKKVQLAEEWAVHFSKRAFGTMPAATKERFKADYESQLKRTNDADQQLVDAVNAAKTGDHGEQVDALTAAVTDLVLLLQKAQKAALASDTPPSAADQTSIAEDLTNARKHVSDLQFLAKN